MTASPALAAGGAHVVDDSEVETPGTCHVETSITRLNHKAGLAAVSPGCTPFSIANLEIDVDAMYDREPGADDFTVGPSLKWNLRLASSGLGVAINASAAWASLDKRMETASLIVPVTMPIGEGLTANVNAGVVWTRSDADTSGFFGGQLVWQRRTNLGFMIEAFDRTGGEAGAQAGVRWNPDENTDIDVLVSHDFNGTVHENATFGVTKRF